MFITGVNNIGSAVATTPAKSLSPVSTTPAINPCHGFSVIAGVVNTNDKFISGVNVTGEQLSLVALSPAIILLIATTLAINLLPR